MKKLVSIIILTILVFSGMSIFLFHILFASDEPNLVKLTIKETSGIDRVKEPVTSGVPLSKDTVFNVNQLRVLDSNKQEVPSQFKVLSRWGQLSDTTKAIKWVLVDFQADVAANSNATYYLEHGSEFTKDYGLNLLTDNHDLVSFDTGKLKFSVDKNSFRLFDNVSAGGKQVVGHSEQNGIFIVENGTGKVYNSLLGPPLDIDVEENGPLKAVLQVQGPLMDSEGEYLGKKATDNPRLIQPYPYVHYNARITVYKGKSYAKVLFIFENDGTSGTWPENKYAEPQNIYIEDLRLKTSVGMENPSIIYTTGNKYSGNKAVLATRGQYDNISDTFPYTLNIDGSVVENGVKYPGWIEVSQGEKNISLGMKYFWQKHPVDITYDNGSLEAAVMPEGQGYPLGVNDYYLFDGGRHYGVELLYRFNVGIRNAQETQRAMVFLQDPLFAFALPDYYALTKAWKIAPSYVQVSNPELQEAINRYEKQVLAQADIDYAEVPPGSNSANTLFSYRGDSAKWFGSFNFGDIIWANDYASLHYDWAQGMLLHMLRHSNTALWIHAQELIPHERDIDQYWGDRMDTLGEDIWINHLSRYESDCHNRCPNSTPKASHNWNGGLILSYLLTGDEESLEAAKEHYLYASKYYKKRLQSQIFGGSELRMQGWTIVGLLNLYRALGNQEYIDLALAIGKNDLLYGEQMAGGTGVWEGPDNTGPWSSKTEMQNTMYMYVSEPLTDLYEEIGDSDIGQLIVRMTDYNMQKNVYGGDYNKEGLYKPLQTDYYYTGTETRSNGGATLRGYFFADLAAAAYQETGDSKYLNFARNLFKDVSFYYIGRGYDGEYINPSRRDVAIFADNMYASTWSKVKGWLLRAHQVYLNVENQVSSGDIDGNNEVNILDLQLCVNVVLGIEIDPMIVSSADVNEDKKVDVSDVQVVVNMILAAG